MHDVQQHRQFGKTRAVSGVHQPRARQTRVATQLGRPGQHARSQNRAQNNDERRLLRPHSGYEVSPNLHDQQPYAQTEPQCRVVTKAKRALSCG